VTVHRLGPELLDLLTARCRSHPAASTEMVVAGEHDHIRGLAIVVVGPPDICRGSLRRWGEHRTHPMLHQVGKTGADRVAGPHAEAPGSA
jgi:hypothetical protein